MSKNSERIYHDVDKKNNTYRNGNVEQILNDINEDLETLGFIEPTYKDSPQQVFLDKITAWDDGLKSYKRAEILINYGTSFPFIQSITKNLYNEDGTAIVATSTFTVNLFANKTLQNALGQSSR